MGPIKLSRKTWLFFIVPIVGIVVLFIFLSRPKLNNIKELDGQIEQENEKLAQNMRIARTKDLLVKEISKMQDAIDYYERRIPSDKGTAWLLMELSRVARSTGIKYISITPQAEEKKGSYIKVPMQIKIRCGYHGLGRFVNRIESSQRFMTVDNIVISPDGANPLRHNITLLISTFMFAQ